MDKINIKNNLGDFILPKLWVPKEMGGDVDGIIGDVGTICTGKILSQFILDRGIKYLKKDSTVLE